MSDKLEIVSVENAAEWTSAIVCAIDECARRNGDDQTESDLVFSHLQRRIKEGACICLIVVDRASGQPAAQSVCGLLVLDVFEDICQRKCLGCSTGWSAPAYHGQPIALLIEASEKIAIAQGCTFMCFIAGRAIAAYERWIKPWGFEGTMMMFRKRVAQ